MRRNGRVFSAALMSTAACSALTLTAISAGAGPALAAPAGNASPSAAASGSEHVIIFLNNQFADAGSSFRPEQRSAQLQAAQAPVVGQLQQLGAKDVHGYRLSDAISARIPASAVTAIKDSPGVASVIPDSTIQGPDPAPAAEGPATAGTKAAGATAATTPAGACSKTPQLEPEGLAATSTASTAKGAQTARSLGYTGAGVKVAFLADGIDPANANLQRSGKSVITDYKDFSGDGPAAATAGGEAFMDANAIAGQGVKVYNVAGFSARKATSACNVQIQGTADGASLVALKVFSASNTSSTSGFLAAIDYAVNVAHVKVLNESFGANPFPDVTSLDAVKQFNDMAAAAGVTVVVASGDGGSVNTIGSPASDPNVISVGATTDFRYYAQTNFAGADKFAPDGWESGNISSLSSGGYTASGGTLDLLAPGDMSFASCTASAKFSSCVNGLGKKSAVEQSGGTDQFAPHGWESGNISSLSSSGYTASGGTLNLVAPGDMSFASCTASTRFSSCVNDLDKKSPVEQSGGTSQSAPLVAGAAALVIQAYAKAHHGGAPTAANVKQILMSSATDLGAPATEQGAGLLNSLKAVEMAASTSAHRTPGPTLKLAQTQLSYTGKPGAAASWTVTATNTSNNSEKVSVSGRQLGSARTVKQATVTLSDAASPHFTSWSGLASNYGTVKFTVPAGAKQLDASIAYPATSTASASQNARVRVILVNPAGKLAGDSLPQGVSGYGSAQVLRPAAGSWTAVIFSDTAKNGGTAGPVKFGATVTGTRQFAALSIGPGKKASSVTLAAGASAAVHVLAKVPAGAGDSSGSVVLTAGGASSSIPVTLRGQIVARKPGSSTTFDGVLTGGNGRSPGEGQVETYSIVVPSNLRVLLRNLDVDVALDNDPANQVSAYLVSPGGETMGYGSSYLTTGFSSSGVPVETPQKQLSVYTSNPIPGTWTLVVDFTSPVPGNELTDDFHGKVRLNAVSFSRGTLPDTSAVTLKAGRDHTYKIAVHNTGAAPEDIFLDPRLTTTAAYPLAPQNTVSNMRLPLSAKTDPPEWIVPTMTHSVSVTARSSAPRTPVAFDFGPFPGDPDEQSRSGVTATATFPVAKAITPITQGLWFANPAETGPFGTGGAASASVSMSATAVTQAFDTHAASTTGDFWRFSVAPLAAAAHYGLLTVKPGQTKTVTLTIKPAGATGSVVRGMLYIDDFADSLQFLSGSQLVALPYQYKIG